MKLVFTHLISPKKDLKKISVYDRGDREIRKKKNDPATFPRFKVVCLRHGHFVFEPVLIFAKLRATNPELWCDGCKRERDNKLEKALSKLSKEPKSHGVRKKNKALDDIVS